MNILKRTEAVIDIDCIKHNFNEIKRYTNGAKMICVVKADAYGHGAPKLARVYEDLGADILAVACLDEARELSDHGIKTPIIILGATPISLAGFLVAHNFIQSVHSLEYAEALNEAAAKAGGKINVHIKLDTGMSRFGIYAHSGSISSATDAAEKIVSLSNLCADGIFTHFAEAENSDTSFTDEQFENFMSVVENLKKRGITFKFCHCANSAAVVNYKRAHLSCVRPGLLLYGYTPSGEQADGLDIRPAMTLKSLIADIRYIKQGDSVSYNRTFIADRNMKVAVVCCGYADGIHRTLSRKGYFLINGKRAPILGNVCMDLTIVDVSDIDGVKPFDEAILFGIGDGFSLSANEVADDAGTIAYEILTSVSKRVPRTYLNSFA